MVESIIGEVGARHTDFLPKSRMKSRLLCSSISAPLVAVSKGFDAYGTLNGCLEDGTMANKHVFTCGTKTFPRKKCERYFRTVRIAGKEILSIFLSGWRKLFNGIKH